MPKEFIEYRRAAARAGKTLGEFVYEPLAGSLALSVT